MNPTTDDQRQLEEAAFGGDAIAEERLLICWLPLVRKLARIIRSRRLDFADRCQAGSIGLLLAIRTYDPGRGAEFSTYAWTTISNEIRTEIKRKRIGTGISFPTMHKVNGIVSDRRANGEDEMSQLEISSAAEVKLSTVQTALAAWQAKRGFLPAEDKENEPGSIPSDRVAKSDLLPDIRLRLHEELEEIIASGQEMLALLERGASARCQEVMKLRYGLDGSNPPMNHRDVAERLGISFQRVEQIEKKAFRLLVRRLGLADLRTPPTPEEDRQICRRSASWKRGRAKNAELFDLRLEQGFPALREKLARFQNIPDLREALNADLARPAGHA